MNKKSFIINAAVAVLITALAALYLAKNDVITAKSLSLIPWYAFVFALAFFAAGEALLSLVDFSVYKTFTRDMTYFKCIKNTFFGHLGSSVTPYRAGHFPLMAYYQKKDGVKFTDTLTGFVKCQIIYSVTSIAVYSVVVIVLAAKGSTVPFNGVNVALWSVMAMGLGFHIIVFALNIVLAFNLPLQKAALKTLAKIIKKVKKTFDDLKFIKEKEEKLKIFKEQISLIGKKFYYYLIPAGLYAVYMFFSGAIQYVAFLLVSGEGFVFNDYLLFYVLFLSSQYITNVVPVPGGAGASEVVFSYIYASVIAEGLLGSVLVLWRASTFYFAVVLEITALLIFIIAKGIKRKNAPKNGKGISTDL